MRIHSALDTRHSALRRDAAFTLIELLVVIGIIALLASILFPVISKVRESAREADTKALIGSIEAACQTYHQDFNAYPGPLSNAYVTAQDQTNFGLAPANWDLNDTGVHLVTHTGTTTTTDLVSFNLCRVEDDGTVTADGTQQRVTAAENLVLGLLGGLAVNKQNVGRFFPEFDPVTVGQGPALLNPVRAGRHGNYMQPASLSTGRFVDDNGQNPDAAGFLRSRDSAIPEFVDRFQQPMPILVLRGRTGGRAASQTPAAQYKADNNDVVVNLPSSVQPNSNYGAYNLVDITPYTQSMIGAPFNLKQNGYLPSFNPKFPHGDPMTKQGLTNVAVDVGMNKGATGETVTYPYNAFAYFADPSSYDTSKTVANEKAKMKARKQDTIILISAGRDRVFGTDDDVTNFGSVKP